MIAVIVSIANSDAAARGLACIFLIGLLGACVGAMIGAIYGVLFWGTMSTDSADFWKRAHWGERWIPRIVKTLGAIGAILALLFHGWIHRLLGLGAALALLLAPGRPLAWDRSWSRADTALEVTYATVAVVDWTQTAKIVKSGRRETNPILGERPSLRGVALYFPSMIAGHFLVSRLLPAGKPRAIWQAFTIGMESEAVIHNVRVRVGFSVPW